MQANFTPRSQEILVLAKKLARKHNHRSVYLEHLLLSILKIDRYIVPSIKSKIGNKVDLLESSLQKSLDNFPEELDHEAEIFFSKELESCITFALQSSQDNSDFYVSVEHLLYSLIANPENNIIHHLISVDIDFLDFEDVVLSFLQKDFLLEEQITNGSFSSQLPPKSNLSPLELYGTDLNILAKQGQFDFIFPNVNYIKQLESTLCRKTKSSALLVGDAGVGKTALVEGLAKKIVRLESNDYLISKEIISLDLSVMVAGTKYRGQFEERLNQCIEEAKSNPNIILFIDEIHTMVGAGNSEGSLDAANILKPYLARGEITCIGSTTHGEYKSSFAKDPALRRRFDVIQISEPTLNEAKKLLIDITPDYANYHNVAYSIDTIDEAIKLSNQYITNKKLPDKAIDLIDQAGANVKIAFYKKPKSAKKMEKVLMSDDVDIKIKNQVYDDYKKMMSKWGKSKQKKPAIVKPTHIREIISKKLHIPLETLNETLSTKVLKLESRMSKDVFGQSEAIIKICNSLYKSQSGLKDPNRPIGSFLFLGKTGVGKTLTSKSLAQHYFGSSKKLIYFDMSEFTESTAVSKFSGSSPGYIGYEKGGVLTEKVKKDPHCVLLFDEVEKAHPTVLQSLLQVLEEGRMTDNSGEETCFKNTIIILTSNLGADLIDKGGSVGFMKSDNSHKDKVLEEAKRKLSPELVNRFDGVVLFNNFGDNDFHKIIQSELKKVKAKLKVKNISLRFSSTVTKFILNKAKSENLGGRPVRRIINNELEVSLSKFMLQNEAEIINVKVSNGEFICEQVQKK